MWKGIVIILTATVVVSIGNGLLSKGLKELHALEAGGPLWSVAWAYVSAGLRNPLLVVGGICHGLFFAGLLLALSLADLSLVVPLTALTYVFAALIGHFWLHEPVDTLRWVGAVIIMVGVIVLLVGEGRNPGPLP